MLCPDLVKLRPDQVMIVEVEAAGDGPTSGPAGSMISVVARLLAARKSRLSIMAEVKLRWLTIDPERGRQDDPVWRSKCSAA